MSEAKISPKRTKGLRGMTCWKRAKSKTWPLSPLFIDLNFVIF